MSTHLPDDNANANFRNYLLDPLSVIVKLAILASKPVGTKMCIQNNVLTFQEPGIFQGFCRTLYKLNKTDLHYIYNPIQCACAHFFSSPLVKSHPRIRNLFVYAQRGLERLMDTYRTNSTVRHSLSYYYALIANYTETGAFNQGLFRKDGISVLYAEEMTLKLNAQWTNKWLTMVLDTIGFLSDESISTENTRILESLMTTIDAQTQKIFLEQFQGLEVDGFAKSSVDATFEETNPLRFSGANADAKRLEVAPDSEGKSDKKDPPPLAIPKQKGSKN